MHRGLYPDIMIASLPTFLPMLFSWMPLRKFTIRILLLLSIQKKYPRTPMRGLQCPAQLEHSHIDSGVALHIKVKANEQLIYSRPMSSQVTGMLACRLAYDKHHQADLGLACPLPHHPHLYHQSSLPDHAHRTSLPDH